MLAIGRGSSTLALAAAVADLAIINLALAIGLLLAATSIAACCSAPC